MHKQRVGLLVLVLLVASMIGCTSGNPEPRSQFDDAVIASQVRTALAGAGGIPVSGITVLVDRGIVTLRGSVPSVTDAERAVSVAGEVAGVVQVRNELSIGG